MAMLSLVLAALAYGCFYAASPGRQARGGAPGSPRVLRAAGAVGTLGALALAAQAYGHGIGPLLVLTVMMATASALALAGPLVFDWAASHRASSTRARR
jgi:hypothetical protein